MQPNYFTPIKTIQEPYNRKLFNSDSCHRQGDWICLNCQNLNYSFRKKCNRCKTQSRQENEAHSVYSYYYYPPQLEQPLTFTTGDQPLNQKNTITNDNHNLSHEQSQISLIDDTISDDNKENIHINEFTDTILQTPKKKKPIFQSATKLDGLPSVSPLIKKHRLKQHHTTLEKQHKNLSTIMGLKQSPSKNNYNLPDVRVRDFDHLINDFDASPEKQFEQDHDSIGLMKDIEDSIARIII